MYFMFASQCGETLPPDDLETDMTPKAQRTVSLGIGGLGLALLIMMVTTEGEPGALPLGLILLGAIGYVTGRMRKPPSRRP